MDSNWLCERVILAPKNQTVDSINFSKKFQKKAFFIDTVIEQKQEVNYLIEFLNSLHPPGMLSQKLELKENVSVLLLRNVDPLKLCNGTRLIAKKMLPHLLEDEILIGLGKEERALIPRIPLIPADLLEFKKL